MISRRLNKVEILPSSAMLQQLELVLYAIERLLEHGASPNAINSNVHNALMRCMASIGEWSGSCRNIVRFKDKLLLKAGCNPNHHTRSGFTTSCCVIGNFWWYGWCSALEYSGLEICTVFAKYRTQQTGSFSPLARVFRGCAGLFEAERSVSAHVCLL